ncbi:DUF5687 family protein [Chryseobacterium indoltheticum]|uniref:DUF5687 family protein n=1 Tax=Chryseobacterium indoltheticum TaxID=254 RepID=UPI003F492EE7
MEKFFSRVFIGNQSCDEDFQIYRDFFFILWLAMMSFIAYFYVQEEMKQDPLKVISRFLIIGWLIDLVFKYLIQQIPTQNIKPFLTLNIPKKVVVNYTLIKTFLTPLSWLNSIFIVTFCGILAFNGYGFLGIFTWFIGVSSMFYLNNFLNLLFNDKKM